MTKRERRYHQRKKIRPAYSFTVGGSRSAKLTRFTPSSVTFAAVDKDGNIRELNTGQALQVFDYWTKDKPISGHKWEMEL